MKLKKNLLRSARNVHNVVIIDGMINIETSKNSALEKAAIELHNSLYFHLETTNMHKNFSYRICPDFKNKVFEEFPKFMWYCMPKMMA